MDPIIRNLILDMDGVLWRGETPMPGLKAFFDTLNELNINYMLATNNATKVATQYTQKLARYGVDIPAEHIMTSAEVVAAYLRQEFPDLEALYVVGEEGLRQAVQAKGFTVISPEQVQDGAKASVVVGGFTRELSYGELAMGSLLVHNGAKFFATNLDVTFPNEIGPLPGAGSVLAVISTATGVQPTVTGKPGPIMFQQGLKRLGAASTTTAMVGDRLNTDILGGKNAGMHTVLLLSGVTQREDLDGFEFQPDYVYQDISELADVLRKTHVAEDRKLK